MKESHNALIPLKLEKENRFLDQVWITSTSVPTLVALAAGNLILILQNDVLKRTVEIDVGNLNIVDAPVSQVNLGETEIDDIYGLNNVIDEIIKDKDKKDSVALTEKVSDIDLLKSNKFVSFKALNQAGNEKRTTRVHEPHIYKTRIYIRWK